MSAEQHTQRVLSDLLAAAQRGERAAQAELFRTHRHRVAQHVFRMTGDESSVDDLVQDVFVSAFNALSRFRGESQLDTWLYRIAVNKVRNWWDSQRRRRRREELGQGNSETEPETPERALEIAAHRRRLYDALGGLPYKLREAFVARAIEGMSLAEASVCLGVPVSTVSYRTRRAERLLCKALGIEEVTE